MRVEILKELDTEGVKNSGCLLFWVLGTSALNAVCLSTSYSALKTFDYSPTFVWGGRVDVFFPDKVDSRRPCVLVELLRGCVSSDPVCFAASIPSLAVDY